MAAGACLLSPFIPLLFMGEEYGETAHFPYFISHSDEDLARAVREGRKRVFGMRATADELPDPSAPATFESAKLDRWLTRGEMSLRAKESVLREGLSLLPGPSRTAFRSSFATREPLAVPAGSASDEVALPVSVIVKAHPDSVGAPNRVDAR